LRRAQAIDELNFGAYACDGIKRRPLHLPV
jgi:hypothetical protein